MVLALDEPITSSKRTALVLNWFMVLLYSSLISFSFIFLIRNLIGRGFIDNIKISITHSWTRFQHKIVFPSKTHSDYKGEVVLMEQFNQKLIDKFIFSFLFFVTVFANSSIFLVIIFIFFSVTYSTLQYKFCYQFEIHNKSVFSKRNSSCFKKQKNSRVKRREQNSSMF